MMTIIFLEDKQIKG